MHLVAVAVGAATALHLGLPPATAGAASGACPALRVGAGYSDRVRRALAEGRDVWGDALLRARNGPTYAGAAAYLKPLLLAGHLPGERSSRLTDSAVYYLPFGQPSGVEGADAIALHVADGGQIAAERTRGRRLSIFVGAGGRERYGSCLPRLLTPRLYGGYLPILETRYADRTGARYRQESFAARDEQTQSLVSFVRLTAEPRPGQTPSPTLRFTPSVAGGSALSYLVRGRGARTVYVAWPIRPAENSPRVVDRATYERARRSLIDYWNGRLAEGTTFIVPERRVLDAERSLLIQNLELTWRYSIGNAYEVYEFPESLNGADVLGRYGFPEVEKAIVQMSFRRPLALYPNWQMGTVLLSSARYYRVSHDSAYIAEATPILQRYTSVLGRQLDANPNRLLRRERFASDLSESAYGLNGQAVVLQGLRAMAHVWSETGHPDASAAARRHAVRLENGLRAAVRRSATRLRDGSLFIPVELLTHAPPYGHLTASRAGSYWNLVMPYALASGLLPARGPEASGLLGYMRNHGSRFLGLVRAGAYSLYTNPAFPTSGSDQVYGMDVARFFAARDDPDQLVLSLYGQLAAGMTRGTFVSGEAATIAPVAGDYYRSMYLPPNSVSNATFLETLRLMLVQETETRGGRPNGLRLAYATPRGWLDRRKKIVVREAPTSFGPISFSLEAKPGAVDVSVDLPKEPPPAVRLRLRLRQGNRITGVVLNGRPHSRVDERTGTIDLSGQTGHLSLTVRTLH
jgi:hypothetical protein